MDVVSSRDGTLAVGGLSEDLFWATPEGPRLLASFRVPLSPIIDAIETITMIAKAAAAMIAYRPVDERLR